LVFKVFAYSSPDDSAPTLVGKIYSKGPATTSYFGDTQLMFAHNDFADDLEIKPEWKSSVPYFSADLFKLDESGKPKVGSSQGSGCPLKNLVN